MNQDYLHAQIQSTTTNTFTVTCADSGGSSGSDGAYIPVFRLSTFTDSNVTVAAPTVGGGQLISITISYQEPLNNTTLSLPTNALSAGGGINSSTALRNPPSLIAYGGNNGLIISNIGYTFSTTGTYGNYSLANDDTGNRLLLHFIF